MRRVFALAADRSGATAVEFALVVMPLLLLLFAIVEYGRLAWTTSALQQVAIETARCMGVGGPKCADATGVYSAALTTQSATAAAAALSVAAPTVTLNRAATCGGVSGLSQITLTTTFVTAVPQLLTALAGGVTLVATACYPNQS
jgi:Flp pilus assembly protein TadG